MPYRFLLQTLITSKSFALSNQVKHCPINMFKDEIQRILFSDHFFQLNHVLVTEFSKHFDLSESHTFFPGAELAL